MPISAFKGGACGVLSQAPAGFLPRLLAFLRFESTQGSSNWSWQPVLQPVHARPISRPFSLCWMLCQLVSVMKWFKKVMLWNQSVLAGRFSSYGREWLWAESSTVRELFILVEPQFLYLENGIPTLSRVGLLETYLRLLDDAAQCAARSEWKVIIIVLLLFIKILKNHHSGEILKMFRVKPDPVE